MSSVSAAPQEMETEAEGYYYYICRKKKDKSLLCARGFGELIQVFACPV